jgi:hypothetical protein
VGDPLARVDSHLVAAIDARGALRDHLAHPVRRVGERGSIGKRRHALVFSDRQLPPGSRSFQAVDTVSVEGGAGRKLVQDTMYAHNDVFKK